MTPSILGWLVTNECQNSEQVKLVVETNIYKYL